MRRSLAALALAVVLPLPSLAPAAVLANVVVKPGETLSEIADRHGVSVTRLMQANGITNPNLVVAGQKLVLPGARSTTTRSGSGSVTVQPGETLSEIADRQGISVTRLMQANGITNPNLVVAGQKLVLPGARSTTSTATPRPLPTAPYTVKSGETLSEIADRFGTSTERLIQLNRIGNPNMVVAGTRLAIPGRPSSAARSTTSPRPPAPRNAKEHVVRSGESLSTIADSYGLPVEKLVAINKIDDPDLVVSGTRLKLQAPPPVKAPVKAPAKAAAKPLAQPKPKPAPATVTAAPATAAPAAPKPTVSKPVVTATAAAPNPVVTSSATPVTPTATSPVTATPASRSTAITAATATAQTATAQTATPQTATPQPAASKPAANKPVTTATRATTTRPSTTSKAGSSKPQGPDWRSYGPLQVDWANWQPMGGSYVAPTLNGDGKPVYLAVNCGARKLNATSQSGQWRSWDAPQTDFEEQLISDICKARAS